MSTITPEKVKEMALGNMRACLKSARVSAELAGFGYEVTDAIRELIDFAEFEMDELEIEY